MKKEDFLSKDCQEPPETGVLSPQLVHEYLKMFPEWKLSSDNQALVRQINATDFLGAVRLINKIAEIAETEQHHPDVRIYSYKWLELSFSTHSIGGLSENDFVMAAKVDEIL